MIGVIMPVFKGRSLIDMLQKVSACQQNCMAPVGRPTNGCVLLGHVLRLFPLISMQSGLEHCYSEVSIYSLLSET
jgi:hypothetical protein